MPESDIAPATLDSLLRSRWVASESFLKFPGFDIHLLSVAQQRLSIREMHDDQPPSGSEHAGDFYKRYYESFSRSYETSVRYAEMYLKNCIVLNGGSILAFPTLAQLTNISVDDHKAGFIVSMVCLSLGLVASLLSVAAAAGWFDKKMELANIDYHLYERELNHKKYDADDPKEFWNERYFDDVRTKHNLYAKVTINLGKAAGILFIIGIVSAGLVISEIDLLVMLFLSRLF